MIELEEEPEKNKRLKELAEQIKPIIKRRGLERGGSTTVSLRDIEFNDEKEFKYSTFMLNKDASFPYDILGGLYEHRTIRVYKKYNAID